MDGMLLSGPWLPFSLALGILGGLLVLELAALLLGGSLLAGDVEGAVPDFSTDLPGPDPAFDLATGSDADIGQLLAASESVGMADRPDEYGPSTTGFLGLGQAPFGIWLAALLLGYGLSGYALQGAAFALFRAPVAPLWAAAVTVVPGVIFARFLAGFVARAIPRLETTATSAQFMGGLRGVVSQGVARAGQAAEVRVRDRHGNLHFLRCEPFDSADTLVEGTDVLTVRERRGPGDYRLRILPISRPDPSQRTKT